MHKQKMEARMNEERRKKQKLVEEQFQKVLKMQEQLNVIRSIGAPGPSLKPLKLPEEVVQAQEKRKKTKETRKERKERFGGPGAAFEAGVLPEAARKHGYKSPK